MLLYPISVAMDLSEVAFAQAKKQLGADTKSLGVSTNNAQIGSMLARKNDLPFFIDTDLPKDGWYVLGAYTGVFSLGA